MRRSFAFVITAYALLAAFSTQCLAIMINTDTLGTQKRGEAEYYNINPDQRATLRIHLLAGVQAPGVYHLPDNSNLLEAIALAGGANANADLSKVHVRRMTGTQVTTYDYDMTKVVGDSSSSLPTLANNDMVLIESQPQNPDHALQIIATILGIVTSGLLAYVTVHTIQTTH